MRGSILELIAIALRVYRVSLSFQSVHEWCKEINMGMERMGVRFSEEGREWRLPDS